MLQTDSPPRRLRTTGKTWRSERYLAFVRSRPSVVSGSEHNVVAHHVRSLGGGGMGLKPPDWMCLPLTTEEHTILHSVGEQEYWRQRGEDPMQLICMTMLVYLAANPSMDLVEALGAIIQT